MLKLYHINVKMSIVAIRSILVCTIDNDSFIQEYQRLTDSVHQHGSKITLHAVFFLYEDSILSSASVSLLVLGNNI